MHSGHSGAHAQKPVVHSVWRELDDARAFVRFESWVVMVPKRKSESAARKTVKVIYVTSY